MLAEAGVRVTVKSTPLSRAIVVFLLLFSNCSAAISANLSELDVVAVTRLFNLVTLLSSTFKVIVACSFGAVNSIKA